MLVVAPKGASTCRSEGPKDVWIERTYDGVVASGHLKGRISQMEVVEDVDSRPHKAVSLCGKKREGNQRAVLDPFSTVKIQCLLLVNLLCK